MPAPRATPLGGDSLFRSVFDNTLEAIVVMDGHGRVLEATAEASGRFAGLVPLLRPDGSSFHLGLAATLGIVRGHRGTIKVASAPLRGTTFTVMTARDGSEGVSMFDAGRDRISLVLLDLTMPTLGGEEAFRAMLRMRSDVRVVLMSGYSSHELAARYGAEGIAGFIQKPFRVEELEACLTSVLDNPASA